MTEAGQGASGPARVVDEINLSGAGDVLLICEHASNHIPPALFNLGLTDDLLRSHIAWDPGALPVAVALSKALDAPLLAHRLSRLVYDCNRPPEAESAVPAISEIHPIPGNANLAPEDREARVALCYTPFRNALRAAIDRRIAMERPPVLVTIHSFTPVYRGERRDVEIGILHHDADSRLADAMLDAAASDTRFDVRRNAPYGQSDGVMHTLHEHGVSHGLLNVMIEIRNDLIAATDAQIDVAQWLAARLRAALDNMGGERPRAQEHGLSNAAGDQNLCALGGRDQSPDRPHHHVSDFRDDGRAAVVVDLKDVFHADAMDA
ncbi:N-formylglutamate amidohydrolase [Breoghania sp. L-A4]|uniref:N-formylglutamate amidohydrolase n=1 Tax=Breoghania sp. L-A4 TaxID=2304600 RepID=UPI0020BF1423|nr:N-formylglutamate amidohydrolase [Breoghania sp. L-A4]